MVQAGRIYSSSSKSRVWCKPAFMSRSTTTVPCTIKNTPLTLLGPQSRFWDNRGQTTWDLGGMPPKRDWSSKRVKTMGTRVPAPSDDIYGKKKNSRRRRDLSQARCLVVAAPTCPPSVRPSGGYHTVFDVAATLQQQRPPRDWGVIFYNMVSEFCIQGKEPCGTGTARRSRWS